MINTLLLEVDLSSDSEPDHLDDSDFIFDEEEEVEEEEEEEWMEGVEDEVVGRKMEEMSERMKRLEKKVEKLQEVEKELGKAKVVIEELKKGRARNAKTVKNVSILLLF